MNRDRVRHWTVVTAGILVGAAVWQIVGERTDPTFFAPLSATLRNLVTNIGNGTLPEALGTSLSVYVVGLVAGIFAGALAGLALARSRALREAFAPYVTALYATPIVALVPFILATLGYGTFPKQLVVFLFVVFPVLLNTLEGAQSVPPELLDVGRAYRSTERQLWRHVVIPYTFSYTVTGARQGLARGLVGMVVAEFFLSSSGLGQMIIIASGRFDSPTILSTTLVITLLGLLLMTIGSAIEARFSRWRISG